MLYFVYELIDPRDNIPFYVGITDNPNRRMAQHLMCMSTNLYKDGKVKEIQDSGLSPKMRILETHETKREALYKESLVVKQYLAQGFPLTNLQLRAVKAEDKPFDIDPDLVTREQAEEELGIGPCTLDVWRKQGMITVVRYPHIRKFFYRKSELERLAHTVIRTYRPKYGPEVRVEIAREDSWFKPRKQSL